MKPSHYGILLNKNPALYNNLFFFISDFWRNPPVDDPEITKCLLADHDIIGAQWNIFKKQYCQYFMDQYSQLSPKQQSLSHSPGPNYTPHPPLPDRNIRASVVHVLKSLDNSIPRVSGRNLMLSYPSIVMLLHKELVYSR